VYSYSVHDTNAPHEELYIELLCCFCFCCLRVSFNFQFALLCTSYTTASHPRGVLIFLLLLLLLKFFPHTYIYTHRHHYNQVIFHTYICTYNGVIRTYSSKMFMQKLQATNCRGGGVENNTVKSSLVSECQII